MWSDDSKLVGGDLIVKKCCLYLDIVSCVKINVFGSFFTFRVEMHVRCDN